MQTLVSRTVSRWQQKSRRAREARQLAGLPDHLLADIGLAPGSPAALAMQLRERER